ncbi:DNA-binding protein [Bradyrhizobium sp. ISRA443]|uniref:DNA-binding protein n=1 Tax=unclassified Bradyrhizobium TaxID=2631580 RepID=UPI00247A72B6|nr:MULTISPECIES: DNA-binding protein [unclassified Bradyrhizobium]WGR91847.1 DNA-binding protein [Bradyrhizobium sp. ISRA435]WGS02214.1 DNA-binding protein [Bradyrhizobium sp. ISRA436]WGS09099.1 DNA-binding protein [Bradyrhizobium sp. ISRA437]WGS15988.1 DNA-binding protein [Bradyrhizobium sp. ISRA443]
MSNPELPEFLKGRIVCSPEDGMRAINAGRTKFYELLNAKEIRSYMDGARRQVVVASLLDYVQRRLEASNKRAA